MQIFKSHICDIHTHEIIYVIQMRALRVFVIMPKNNRKVFILNKVQLNWMKIAHVYKSLHVMLLNQKLKIKK